MRDKGLKQKTIANRLFELSVGYAMFVDADDLLNKNLVSFVENDQHPYGYVFTKGYEYDYARNTVSKTFRFNKLCGTSHILKLECFDSAKLDEKADVYRNLFQRGHYHLADNAKKLGIPLKKLPFSGAMYVVNSNEGHSQLCDNIGFKRKIIRMLTPQFSPSKKIIDTFKLSTLKRL